MARLRKQHAIEEARKVQVVDKKHENTLLWRSISEMQTQLAYVKKALSAQERMQATCAEKMEKHRQAQSFVSQWHHLAEDILRHECHLVLAQLRHAEDEWAQNVSGCLFPFRSGI